MAEAEEASDLGWERLREHLGTPEDPHARHRARELAEEGWELLRVDFTRGVWLFRRPRRPQAQP